MLNQAMDEARRVRIHVAVANAELGNQWRGRVLHDTWLWFRCQRVYIKFNGYHETQKKTSCGFPSY
jgi:hypothetical protein